MKNIKLKIFLIVILMILIFIVFFRNAIFPSSTLYNKIDGEVILNENFESYNDYSQIINMGGKNNLNKWKDSGIITAWALIEDYSQIDKIDLLLKDSNGKEVVLEGIYNEKMSRKENKIKSNDEFSDYEFKLCKDQPLNIWEDFMIINGKNFLFWEWDESLDIDMGDIISIKAVDKGDEIKIFDIVVHKGLCKDINSLNGQWYSPNGLPQYGVWWVENSRLRMVNVEQEQYPSNGDHVRILSDVKTPNNFVMKVVFEVKSLSPDYRKTEILRYFKETKRDNTFVRIAWDFDDVYDPGHDQTLVFMSGEYGYAGLQRVYPIERYFEQGQEPSNKEAKKELILKEGETYEVNVFVKGQEVKTAVYKVRSLLLDKNAEIEYTFERLRPIEPYPFSIESTGDIEIILDRIEIKEVNL